MTRSYGYFPLFDPRHGRTVIEPLASGVGWWAGASSAIWDREQRCFYLYFRLRRPRDLGRGTDCRLARSTDGAHFQDIWAATRDDFQAESVEKASLVKTAQGHYRLYLSYVTARDRKWRIAMMEARRPEEFEPARAVHVLGPEDIGAQGVKDPYVLGVGPGWYMIVSYAPAPQVAAERAAEMHVTGDVYATGITKSHTGLAVSLDGVKFHWLGDILSPGAAWDAYAARVSSVVYRPPLFVAFYDGAATVADNYEEKTGLAITWDLRQYVRLTPDAPALTSPHASGSLRYLDAVSAWDGIYCYYEYARPDGSHELRMNVIEL
jgi:sarcosine oxidase gamma subunit